MKNFIAVGFLSFVLLSTSSVFAKKCIDFSGVYKLTNLSNKVMLTVTQQKCATVKFIYIISNSGQKYGKIYQLDNVRRQTFENNDLIVYETARLNKKALINVVEDFDKATNKTASVISSFALDSKGDLENQNDYYDTKGQLIQSQVNDFARVGQ